MNTTVPGTSIVLTEFARKRLFRAHRRNTIQDITPEEFERHLNESSPVKVLDGYAPFCKLHVHRNWTSTRCMANPIDDANRHLLRSGYDARSREELPVLVRWLCEQGLDAQAFATEYGDDDVADQPAAVAAPEPGA